MTVTIHRGAHQIGGCVTEIKTDNARILIDIGEELPGLKSADSFAIDGVTTGAASCDAVFVTHYHGDHVGLYQSVLPGIPIYMGVAAKEIFCTLSEHLKNGDTKKIQDFKTFKALDKIRIHDITVTPLLVDHSAFDSYMFLIECDGTRILHTGDFRGHGFKGKGLLPTLQNYVGKVDTLIIEGTTLSRDSGRTMTEHMLQLQAAAWMKEKKYVFVLCPSTQIDRIAAFYHANPFGRYFLCDSYQKAVLEIAARTAAPKSSLYDFQKVTTYGSNLEDRFFQRGFCMLVRSRNDHRRIIEKYPEEERLILYSMWKGYLEGECRSERTVQFLDGLDYTYLHTSGHADAETICEVVSAVRPDVIYPIHTQNATWFQGRFGQTKVVL